MFVRCRGRPVRVRNTASFDSADVGGVPQELFPQRADQQHPPHLSLAGDGHLAGPDGFDRDECQFTDADSGAAYRLQKQAQPPFRLRSAARQRRAYSACPSSRFSVRKTSRWVRTVLSLHSCQPKKPNRPFSAASLALTVRTA